MTLSLPTAVTIATETQTTTAEFVRWALDQLRLECAPIDELWRVAVPEARRAEFDEQGELCFTFAPQVAAAHAEAELVTSDGPLVELLIRALHGGGRVSHARPIGAPRSVHQISDQLFSAYTIDGGGVHLAGCRLEDRPFLRLTYRRDGELYQLFVDPTGEEIDAPLAAALGLDAIEVYRGRPPRWSEAEIDELFYAGVSLAQALSPTDGAVMEPLVRTLVWCKYAEGKLRFTRGEAVEELPFAGWAATLTAPPFICPHTGEATYHLAATTDGRLAAADQIGVCQASQTRVLRSELVTCADTEQQVLAEFGEVCPVSGDFVLSAKMRVCPMCQQRVSPAASGTETCAACRRLKAVDKDDPRMARLLGELPGLDRWRKWKLSETDAAYIAVAQSLFKRLLVVVDKQTLAPLHLATGGRFFSGWTAVPSQLREELLR